MEVLNCIQNCWRTKEYDFATSRSKLENEWKNLLRKKLEKRVLKVKAGTDLLGKTS
ncbi:MAG: hypothetical protein NZ895_04960 [Archaeoglobaceae archaeon]|nr:hypothetical protein [Archaeoglobaceae archaeon]MCX8152734.1 hypothetical protein [Archaeoglobaceae archaeon]MDW8013441.1 hypothetical protein [Archaeoglobaceae archaeon]